MTVIYRVRTTVSYGAGGPGLGTCYFLPGVTGGSPSDAQDAVNRVRAFYAAMVGIMYNGSTYLVQGNVDTILDTTGELNGGFSTTPPAAVVGTGGTTSLPVTVCAVIRYNTGTIFAGRRLEGRTFLSPLSSGASTTSGAPTTGVGTAVSAGIAALLGTPGTCIPVVWHRPTTTGLGGSGAITGGSAWSFFGSLRSRRD